MCPALMGFESDIVAVQKTKRHCLSFLVSVSMSSFWRVIYICICIYSSRVYLVGNIVFVRL